MQLLAPDQTPLEGKAPSLLARGFGLLRRHVLLSAVAGFALLALAAWGIVLANVAGSAVQVRANAESLATVAQNTQLTELLEPAQYAGLRQSVAALQEEVKSLRGRMAAAKPLGLLPGVGSTVNDGEDFLALADHTLAAARDTMDGYLPVIQALGQATGTMDYQQVRDALAGRRPLFEQAYQEIQQIKALQGKVDREGLDPSAAKALDLADRYLPALELAVLAARDRPEAVASAVSIRDTVRQARATLRDPSALLLNPQATKELFASLQSRADDVLNGLAMLKGEAAAQDPSLQDALDLGIDAAVLLRRLGDAMTTFAQLSDDLLKAGPLSPAGAASTKARLPELRAALDDAQAMLDGLVERMDKEGAGVAWSSSLLGVDRDSLRTSLLNRAQEAEYTLEYMMGLDRPRTFLFIGQNQDEIRATGGFLGVVAEVHIKDGEIKALRYLDSVNVDLATLDANPIAPDPIFRYLWISRLLFRDANWNPHFPASAAELADLYAKGQRIQADGVMAATENLVLDLVDTFGGVTVPQINGLIDGATAKRYVEGELAYTCTPGHSVDRSKRCFDEDLFQSVLARLMQPMSEDQSRAVLQVFLQALGHKDLLVHVFDAKAGALFWERQWNGAVQQVDHDYLMVVDSMLPGHTRPVVVRHIQYEASLGVHADTQATLLLSYQHTGTQPDPTCRQTDTTPTGCFFDYVRVYVPVLAANIDVPPIPAPEGSELLRWGYEPADTLSIIGAPQAGTERLTEIGGYVMVEPQATVTLPIRYVLPSRLLHDLGNNTYEYRLLIQRQPGMPDEPVTVMVELPEGSALASTSPGPVARDGRWLKFTVTLSSDQLITVQFQGGR